MVPRGPNDRTCTQMHTHLDIYAYTYQNQPLAVHVFHVCVSGSTWVYKIGLFKGA